MMCSQNGYRTFHHDGDTFNKDSYSIRIRDLKSHMCDGSQIYCKCDVVKFASHRISALISQENDLMNHRMTWFANLEGFLWLSFAALIAKDEGLKYGFWLMIIIPVMGIFVCCCAISALWDAEHAVRVLLKKWRVFQENDTDNPYSEIPVIGCTQMELQRSIPKWCFAVAILLGWVSSLVGVVVVIR